MRYFLIVLTVTLFVIAGAGEPTQARDKSGALKGSDLIGMKVEGEDGKKLGWIKDLVIDPSQSQGQRGGNQCWGE